MKKIKLIEIGIGPHAKRVYIPSIKELQKNIDIELCLVVELRECEDLTRNYFQSVEMKPEMLFVESFKGKLPADIDNFLTNYVKNNDIDGVIISTEPLSHYVYAKWALKNGLHILMDKPISTHEMVTSSNEEAVGLADDYLDLLKDYNELQTKKNTVFSVNVQRRFHPGFDTINELLNEIAVKTNCPVTAIQSSHCDGQWRLPSEIVSQNYHPYNTGYGKASHSGYHIFDIVSQFYKTSKITGKVADGMEIYSSFVQPNGLLFQMNENDYKKYFGKQYEEVKKYSDTELNTIYQNYGEVDVSSIVRLTKDGVNIGNISINLMHNGFARRTWVRPGEDLYKGNGRVKHEYHNIEQGPFQNIQVHSYQSNDNHKVNTDKDFETGGNNHFDIYVFRNIGMTGGDKPFEVIRMSDLKNKASEICDDKLAIEMIKRRVVAEFIDFILGKKRKTDLISNITDHLMSVQLMSGVYRSHNNYQQGHNPLVKYQLQL